MIWNGFKSVGTQTAIVANCSTLPHDPDEIIRKLPDDGSIPYSWQIKQK
jgi:dTDP-4-dehydrorhamnose 3,5-epimerase